MTRRQAYKFLKSVKKLRGDLTDDIALNNIDFYPEWEVGEELKVGDRIQYNEKLYKVVQNHTSQADWIPGTLPSLYSPIDLVNEGTLENPIVAAIGMTYYKDKYYLDETDGKIYLCNRDDSNGNGTTLSFMPSALVGHYFVLV